MRPTLRLRHVALPSVLVLSGLVGCSGSTSSSTQSCTTSADCAAGDQCVDSECVAPMDAGVADIDAHVPTFISARIEPSMVTLDASDGAMPTQQLTLIGTRDDGTEAPLGSAIWLVAPVRIGSIDSTGLFTANGDAGGTVMVTARVSTTTLLTAHATVTVTVHHSYVGTGADDSTAGHFTGATPTSDGTSINLLYPLEGAVMPANVYPPAMQWAPVGAAGDLYRVHIEKPHAEVNAYIGNTGADFPYGYAVPRDEWQSIADSDPDDPVTVTVDRFDTASGTVIAAAGPRTFRLARGSIFGAVYYENRTNRANILRIDTLTATLGVVIPNPYLNSAGTACVGCHALTRDGRYAFATNAETSSVYDLTADLTPDPPPSLFPPTGGIANVASFDPTDAYFVGSSHTSSSLRIFDRTTGAEVPSTGLATADAAYPCWSADGQHIVYSGDVVLGPPGSAEPGDPVGGNLYVADRMGGGLDFAPPRPVHMADSLSGEPEGGVDDAHPTWSPDTKFIAFQHGTGTWTHVVRNPGALYLLGVDGMLHRLDNANGGAMGTDGYWPTFAPYVTTEPGSHKYLWLAFYARRDYGNPYLGTQGTGLRQLWVTAIDENAAPGTDPSFVPYWLPGQDHTTSNFSAFWAPEPCRATGEGCSTSSDCCSDSCAPDSNTCAMPETCRMEGESCGGGGECCDGTSCVGNVCIAGLM